MTAPDYEATCCICRLPVDGGRPTYWGGETAHYHCALAAHQTRKPAPASSQPIVLSGEQMAAVEAIERAVRHGANFQLHGRAGTGKTTVLAYLAQRWRRAHLATLSNKAASVITAKAGVEAKTVHSTFYQFVREIEQAEGKPARLQWRPAHEPGSLKGHVLLLDESSMISKDVAADILATGITVVAVGDPWQLPPINGNPFFTKASFTLEEIHRQALENPIIRQAHAVGGGGTYAADIAPGGEGVRVVDQPTDDDLAAADIVLVGLRATRGRLNARCREVSGLSSPLPRAFEPVVCLRTARKYGLYNGAVYYASRDWSEDDKTFGISTDAGDIEVYATFAPPGHEYDKLDLPPGGWMTAFAFGYALTVHIAQGSEFDNVLLVDEWAGEGRRPWLYTGLTRAAKRITIARAVGARRLA